MNQIEAETLTAYFLFILSSTPLYIWILMHLLWFIPLYCQTMLMNIGVLMVIPFLCVGLCVFLDLS